VISELADLCKMDPIDFRLKNILKPGDMLPLGFPCPPLGTVTLLEAVKKHPHYTAPLDGPNRGRGVSFAFWFGAGLMSSAEMALNPDGTVNLSTGSCDLSGTRMTLSMQAAEELGIDVANITASVADTDAIGYTFQSVGSRTTFATGLAVLEVSRKLLKEMAVRVAHIWETEPDNVLCEKGRFIRKGEPEKTLSFADVARQADHTGGPITVAASVNPPSVGFQVAANLVDVEVDPETGKVTLLRYTAFQDVGRAVHPDYVEGQMQGGTVQGIGWALNEEYFYDDKGYLRNPTLLDYRMPTALDVPNIDCVILETPNPSHPYGIRGCGEVPIVPPPAAIADAIKNAIGVRMAQLPMKPGAILEALWAKEAKEESAAAR
jgi:CO/xanthine dehydrogenase Mo-binding subunit